MSELITDHRIEVGGAQVHYLAAGDAPQHLLLLHGSGADSARLSYQHLLPVLARDRTVLAVDFPGSGQSDPTQAAASTDGLIDFVVAFLDTLGIDQIDIAGLSMGGGVALGLTIHHPERVRRAVLMAPHGLVRRSASGYAAAVFTRLPASVYGSSWRYAAADLRRTRRAMRRVWGQQELLDDGLLEEVRRALGRPDAWRTVRNWARSESRWRGYRTYYLDQLADLRIPVLLIHGDRDRLVPIAGTRHAAELLPNAQLEVLPGYGHWTPRECPDQLSRLMLTFLHRPGGAP